MIKCLWHCIVLIISNFPVSICVIHFRNWKNAIQDFTNLLKRKPTDAKTRLLRGRAYVQMTNWNKALEDMSGAIHLDPKNAKAFYYRGCILRK